MTDSIHIPQDDLALYAMRALSPEEAAQVRAHVDACAECREELAALSGDLSLVAMSVEQKDVPEGARQRFLSRIAADAGLQTSHAQTVAPKAQVLAFNPAARRAVMWSIRVAMGAVAALVLVIVYYHRQAVFLHEENRLLAERIQELRSQDAKAQMIMDLLKDPSAQHVMLTAAKSKPAPMAKTVYMASKGALLMQASNLDPLPSNKTYELWVIPMKGDPMPAGMFRPDAAGNASVVMPDMPKGVEAKAFGVTIENAGGSNTPTMPIVLAGAAPAAGL
jgi:Anti-sigma-K factor rskA/Putative zinc-finger